MDVTQQSSKETPYLSDVYKYYDEDLPSNLGKRDPTPPPMSRKEVMNMNKKVLLVAAEFNFSLHTPGC